VFKINIEKILSSTPKRDALFGDNVSYRELFDICVSDRLSAVEKLTAYPKEELWNFILFMYSIDSNRGEENPFRVEPRAYRLLRDVLLSIPAVSCAEDSICFI